MLKQGLSILGRFHDTKEWNEEDIKESLKDIYYVISLNNPQINEFSKSHNIYNLIFNLFLTSENLIESKGLLNCIEKIIKNSQKDINPSFFEQIFQQFQSKDPYNFNDDDEIEFLSSYFTVFRLSIIHCPLEVFNDSFFEHLLSFIGIDNDIDSKIISIFIEMYCSLPQISDSIIHFTLIVLNGCTFNINYNCAQLVYIMSKNFTEIFSSKSNEFNLIISKIFNFNQHPSRVLILESLTNIAFPLLHQFINDSIISYISDSIYHLSTEFIFKPCDKKSPEFASLELLNHIFKNDNNYINSFFNQDGENYNLLPFLIVILEQGQYLYKETCSATFIFLLKSLVEIDTSIFVPFIEKPKMPEQFSSCIDSILALNNCSLTNDLLNYLLLFLQKANNHLFSNPVYLDALNSIDFSEKISENEELDHRLVEQINKLFLQKQ